MAPAQTLDDAKSSDPSSLNNSPTVKSGATLKTSEGIKQTTRIADIANSSAGNVIDTGSFKAGDNFIDNGIPLSAKRVAFASGGHPGETEDEDDDERPKPKLTWRQRLTVEYFKATVKLPFMVTLIVLTYYSVAYLLFNATVGYGTPIFSLFTVVIVGIFGGYLATKVKSAPLLGMLLAGIIVRNIPDVITPLPTVLTGKLRTIALTVILSRAGIGLQKHTIIGNAKTTLLLGIVPVLLEALLGSLWVYLIFQWPVAWSLMLGFGLSSISPGVVVPLLLTLKEERRGIQNGIVPMMLAATGLDVVVGITGFSVCSGLLFSTENDTLLALHGPLELFGGLAAGSFLGFLAYLIDKLGITVTVRTLIVLGFSLVGMLGGKMIGYSGAASLSCMTLWAIVANTWDKSTVEQANKKLKIVWEFAQPFLFPIIGAAISFDGLDLDVVRKGVFIAILGVVTRMTSSFLLLRNTGRYNSQEQLFVAGGWTAKATVQAALSHLAVEYVQELQPETTPGHQDMLERADDMFTIMIFAILVCAPFCATWIQVFGRRWLTEDQQLPNDDPDAPSGQKTHSNDEIYEPSGMGLLDLTRKHVTNNIFEDKRAAH